MLFMSMPSQQKQPIHRILQQQTSSATAPSQSAPSSVSSSSTFNTSGMSSTPVLGVAIPQRVDSVSPSTHDNATTPLIGTTDGLHKQQQQKQQQQQQKHPHNNSDSHNPTAAAITSSSSCLSSTPMIASMNEDVKDMEQLRKVCKALFFFFQTSAWSTTSNNGFASLGMSFDFNSHFNCIF
jgi:hypothetical protein